MTGNGLSTSDRRENMPVFIPDVDHHSGCAVHGLSDNDRAALHEAAELAKAVVARHPHETTGQIFTVLQTLVHDVDVLTRLLEAS